MHRRFMQGQLSLLEFNRCVRGSPLNRYSRRYLRMVGILVMGKSSCLMTSFNNRVEPG